MRIFNEDQLLKEDFRKKVLEEILSPENQSRKDKMKKRYEVFKDNTKPYVLEMLNEESSDKKAMAEALHRAGNVSFTRDIIEKKAMVYKDPVIRISDEQEKVDKIIDILDFNSKMKKNNKYAELFKNSLVTILPYESPAMPGRYRLMMNVYQPYLYDVIEDSTNPEIARVYIFSYYNTGKGTAYKDANEAGNREASSNRPFNQGDGKDQIIADTPDDKNYNEFIWWSHKYHFTTNNKGQIISGRQSETLENPIGFLPMYNFSSDQDGQFWAKGGNDIVDAGILLNLLLTDLFYIAKYQGMGIGYFFGRGVPKNMKVGPAAFVSMEVQDGDPTPVIGFATSNPPIESHLAMIKDYLTYVLLTNNLSPDQGNATVSTSGIHEMVRRSQNTSDIEDQRELYRDGEPVLFQIIFKWLEVYKDLLDPEFAEVAGVPDETDVITKFEDAQPFVSDIDKLTAIEKRIDLGIASTLDAIKLDNPDMTQPEAEEKLRIIKEERLKNSRERILQFGKQNNVPPENIGLGKDDEARPDDQE